MTAIPENLAPAFALIERTDPGLAARMLADPAWTLLGDIDPALITKGYGVTGYRADGTPGPFTEINPLMIWLTASDLGVSADTFAAVVMVHEYVHAGQGKVEDSPEAEAPAYTAASEFARKLPGLDGLVLARFSDSAFAELATR